ncbi:MAG: hypothetical protein AAF611_03825 [Bacteroidota bacterium]
MYTLRGGGFTSDCQSVPCNPTTGYTSDCTMAGPSCTSNTTTHTNPDSITCRSAGCNNDTTSNSGDSGGNTTVPGHSVEIC